MTLQRMESVNVSDDKILVLYYDPVRILLKFVVRHYVKTHGETIHLDNSDEWFGSFFEATEYMIAKVEEEYQECC